jgi:nucleotide-binding universal stress UspA family protein
MSTQMVQPTQTVRKEVKADKRVSLTKIMVLTDFSEVSDLALQYALALARRYDARVYLTHILSPDTYALAEPGLAELTYQKMRQAAEQGFHGILASGKMRGVPHETLLHEGALWPTVEHLIQEREIDLVVTGTRGRGEFKKVVLGSVAEEVFRQAGCPVLTVGPQAWKRAQHELDLNDILFATDFGAGALRGEQYAFSLAQEHGARLTVLHVVEEPALTREAEDRLGEIYIDRMKRFMPAESENWCKVDFRLEFGAPAEAILGKARETGADLIVMGAKARKALAGHRPLTIAYNVVTQAQCPVLTVRG